MWRRGQGSRRGRIASAAVLASAIAGAAAPAAHGEVTFGAAQIRVAVAGAGALIERSPFRLSFTGGEGQTALAEVEGATELPLERSAIDPASEPAGETLYAPLTFLVGSASEQTYTTAPYAGRIRGQYTGDLESVEEAGVEYSAREVLAAEADGEGVRLLVSTDDPSGRTLTVVVTPQATSAGEAIRVAVTPSDPEGVAAMGDSFVAPPGEAFHGFGGRHDGLDQAGREFFNWVDQENVTTTPEQAANPDLYPDGPEAAYYVQSSFVSDDGYGFLLDETALSRWSLAASHPGEWQVASASPALEYVVTPGTIERAAAEVSALSGRAPVPPRWALGPLFDREVEEPEPTPAEYLREVEHDIRRFERGGRRLLLTGYRLEGWGLLSEPVVEGLIARLKALGIRTLLYFRPFTANDIAGTERPGELETALADGYLARTSSGEPYLFTDNFGASAGLIDFTNPAAVAWWRARIFRALELGAEGFMLDFGEQVLPEMRFADGMTGAEMHNLYPVLVQRTTRRIVEEFEALHPGRRIVFFSRSGYSGEPGSAAYANFDFPGDETTDWSAASGLASQAPDMLNRALTGAYGYGTDIGGYLDYYNLVEGREGFNLKPTSRELFLRWAEFAALTPVFRLHGAVVEEHTPWSFPHTLGLYEQLSRLHVAAAGLIERLWREADEGGVPPTRPLYLEYPEEQRAAEQDEEWLLGPDVLVAPVVEQGADGRSVYFPEGCWRDPETGFSHEGPGAATVTADIAQLPFFFRCGSEPFRPPGRFRRG